MTAARDAPILGPRPTPVRAPTTYALTHAAPLRPLDVERLRADFPILARQVHDQPLVYLDNAATTQKPLCVLDALQHFYCHTNANVHRGVHALSQEATDAYEAARAAVARFLHAPDPAQIVFTRGATEAINLVAHAFGSSRVHAGDEILITHMEHHSNIVPWQMLAARQGATLRVAPIDDLGQLDVGAFTRLLSPRTKLVAFTHVSNALGTVNPVRELVRLVHDAGAVALIDGAQAVAHAPIDVVELGCDFYVFSGHKVFGPTGIGALFARSEILRDMPPWQGGGDMIRSVSFAGSTWAEPPYRFEAGTPDIAGAVGLSAALAYFSAIDPRALEAHEAALLDRAERALEAIPDVRLIGRPRPRAGAISFVIEGVHPHDAGTILDSRGIAVRAGHHCAQPVMEHFGVPATLRASFAFYNTLDEVDALAEGVRQVRAMFAP